MDEYWKAIEAKVCVKCIDGDGAGNCRLDPAIACALQQYLPLIVRAVERVSSDRVEDYIAELRGIVCAQCIHEAPGGRCMVREQVDCALDRYFPLVIDAIEEIKARHNVSSPHRG
jgi:hypothetical protein